MPSGMGPARLKSCLHPPCLTHKKHVDVGVNEQL